MLATEQALALLQKYGWLPQGESLETLVGEVSGVKLDDLVAEYQAFHGLEQSGLLTHETEHTLTHRFCDVPDRAQAAGSHCKWPMLDVTFAHRLSFSGLSSEQCDQAYRAACDSWNAVCGIRLKPGEWGRANIWAEAARIDGRSGTLAWSYLPCNATQSSKMQQRYDTGESWTARMLQGVAAHEIGHALGLDHGPTGALMQPYWNGILAPQGWDIAQVKSRYGNPSAPPSPPGDPPVIYGTFHVLGPGSAKVYELQHNPAATSEYLTFHGHKFSPVEFKP